MKTEFKREMNRNYMVLHPEKEIGGSYALRMLSENRINGLLPFQEKRIDGETFLYFNITSRQSLARMMEYRSFKAKEIRQITSDLVVTMTALERFLMDGDQLCLEPDMIYVDPDDLKANFCLLPGSGSQFEESFRKLARYILDHVDHTDGDAVVLAFALFREKRKIWGSGIWKNVCGREKETGKKIFSGKTLERKSYMKQREKWSGNMGQGQQESCRDIREKSKMDQKESTDILRSRKRIFQARQKNWQRRKG